MGGEGDVLADEAAQHRLHAAHDLVQIDDAGLHDLLPAEGEELPGQGGGPVGGLLHQLDVAAKRTLGRELEQQQLAPAGDDGEQVVEVVRDPAGEPPDRFHLLGVTELRLEGPDCGEIAHHDDHTEILSLATLQGRRRDLDRQNAARRAVKRHRRGARRAPLEGRPEDAHQLGCVRQELRHVAAAGRGGTRAAEQGLRRAVQGDHAAIEIEGDDPGDEGLENVVRIALQVGELGELPPELPVCRLEGRTLLDQGGALLVELPGHVVERGGQLPDLVGGRRLDPLEQVPPRDGDGARRELPHGARDPPGDQRGGEPCSGQHEDGQPDQLAASGGDLRLHAAAREADSGRAPALGFDQDRHGKVVERLPVRPVDLLGQGRVRRQDTVQGAAGEQRSHHLRPVIVGRDPSVPVEDHRVGDVRLGAQARHVLLELGVVVEHQRSGGPCGQIAGEGVSALLHLPDDGLALAVLDDETQRPHDGRDDEQRAHQELRLEGAESAGRLAGRGRTPHGAEADSSRGAGSLRRHALILTRSRTSRPWTQWPK